MSAWDEITDEERAGLPARTRIAHGLRATPTRDPSDRGGAPPFTGNPNLSRDQFPEQPAPATDYWS